MSDIIALTYPGGYKHGFNLTRHSLSVCVFSPMYVKESTKPLLTTILN